jgi:hypothetical protein
MILHILPGTKASTRPVAPSNPFLGFNHGEVAANETQKHCVPDEAEAMRRNAALLAMQAHHAPGV